MSLLNKPEQAIYANIDYSSLEKRVLAIYEDGIGRNVHKDLAIELFGPFFTVQQYKEAKAINYKQLYSWRL